jgi:hypothetical protein
MSDLERMTVEAKAGAGDFFSALRSLCAELYTLKH